MNAIIQGSGFQELAANICGIQNGIDIQLCLFINDVSFTSGGGSVYLIQPTDSGYTPYDLTSIYPGCSGSDSVWSTGWPPNLWEFTGSSGSFTLYGFFFQDTGNYGLIGGNRFDPPVVIPADGGSIALTPSMTIVDLGATTIGT